MNNQELKHKAFQVLIDKIDIITFESYLYQLVQENELKSKSILFDFVNINYRLDNCRKEIFNLIQDHCSEIELLSLKIYEKCLLMCSSDKTVELFSLLDEFTSICIDVDYEYNVIYQFYIMDVQKDSLLDGFGIKNEKELIIDVKNYAKKVIDWFNQNKKDENWSKFLCGPDNE